MKTLKNNQNQPKNTRHINQNDLHDELELYRAAQNRYKTLGNYTHAELMKQGPKKELERLKEIYKKVVEKTIAEEKNIVGLVMYEVTGMRLNAKEKAQVMFCNIPMTKLSEIIQQKTENIIKEAKKTQQMRSNGGGVL